MLSVKPLCHIVLLPFSAILTNLILFVFHVSNTITVKPFCNLSLPLSFQPHLGVLCAWQNTYTMVVLHHGLYNFTVFYISAHIILCFHKIWLTISLFEQKKRSWISCSIRTTTNDYRPCHFAKSLNKTTQPCKVKHVLSHNTVHYDSSHGYSLAVGSWE